MDGGGFYFLVWVAESDMREKYRALGFGEKDPSC